MRRIVLASQSPRRKQLLEAMGLAFIVAPSSFEEYLDDARPPEEVAMELGLGKAKAIADKYPDALVIGSDTIVTVDGQQLAKAGSTEEALDMWRLITSGENTVTTSIALVCRALGYEQVEYDNALVYLRPFDKQAVMAYLETGDYRDKAGAYSIQGAGELIDHYDGDRETILGLPTKLLAQMIQDFEQRN